MYQLLDFDIDAVDSSLRSADHDDTSNVDADVAGDCDAGNVAAPTFASLYMVNVLDFHLAFTEAHT